VTPPSPYDPAKFRQGEVVCVIDRTALEEYVRTWRWHHPLRPEQQMHAGAAARVRRSFMYHGVDMLHELDGLPGL